MEPFATCHHRVGGALLWLNQWSFLSFIFSLFNTSPSITIIGFITHVLTSHYSLLPSLYICCINSVFNEGRPGRLQLIFTASPKNVQNIWNAVTSPSRGQNESIRPLLFTGSRCSKHQVQYLKQTSSKGSHMLMSCFFCHISCTCHAILLPSGGYLDVGNFTHPFDGYKQPILSLIFINILLIQLLLNHNTVPPWKHFLRIEEEERAREQAEAEELERQSLKVNIDPYQSVVNATNAINQKNSKLMLTKTMQEKERIAAEIAEAERLRLEKKARRKAKKAKGKKK
eukprot:Gb_07903 [translate_table: standard]